MAGLWKILPALPIYQRPKNKHLVIKKRQNKFLTKQFQIEYIFFKLFLVTDVPNFEKDRFDEDKYVYHSSLLRTFDFSVISTPYS